MFRSAFAIPLLSFIFQTTTFRLPARGVGRHPAGPMRRENRFSTLSDQVSLFQVLQEG